MGFMEFFFETTRDCWIIIHNGGWPELGWWSYLLLILLVATEGPVSTLIGAAAAATGILDIRYVFFSAFFGNVLGDCLWYSIGYVSDIKRIHRFGSWFGLRNHHVDRLEQEMHRHATKLIALSKLAIGLIIPTLVAAGLARVPWRRWFPLVLSIEILWTLLIVNLGYHGAGLLTRMEQGIQLIGIAMLALIVCAAIKYGGRIFHRQEVSVVDERDEQHQLSTNILAMDNLAMDNLAMDNEERGFSRPHDGVVHATVAWPNHSLPNHSLPNHPLQRQFAKHMAYCGKRTAYKQMVHRFTHARLAATPLGQHSLAARSVMTRAMAEAKSIIAPLTTTHPAKYVQEVHFAGD